MKILGFEFKNGRIENIIKQFVETCLNTKVSMEWATFRVSEKMKNNLLNPSITEQLSRLKL
jgi:hypothetical protein